MPAIVCDKYMAASLPGKVGTEGERPVGYKLLGTAQRSLLATT